MPENLKRILNRKTTLIFLGVLLFLLLLAFIYLQSKSPKTPLDILIPPAPSLLPSPTIPLEPYPGVPTDATLPRTPEQDEKDQAVIDILKVQYYNGENFIFNHYPSKSLTRISFYRGREAEGEAEFKEFLEKFNIKDQSWLPNLEIEII